MRVKLNPNYVACEQCVGITLINMCGINAWEMGS